MVMVGRRGEYKRMLALWLVYVFYEKKIIIDFLFYDGIKHEYLMSKQY